MVSEHMGICLSLPGCGHFVTWLKKTQTHHMVRLVSVVCFPGDITALWGQPRHPCFEDGQSELRDVQ